MLERFGGEVEWFEVGRGQDCDEEPDTVNEIDPDVDTEVESAQLLGLANDRACAGAELGDDLCICSRIRLSFFRTSYKKTCGSCQLTLVAEDERDDRRATRRVSSELKSAIRNSRRTASLRRDEEEDDDWEEF